MIRLWGSLLACGRMDASFRTRNMYFYTLSALFLSTSLSVPSGQGANENVNDLDTVKQVTIQCAAIYPVIGCFIAS